MAYHFFIESSRTNEIQRAFNLDFAVGPASFSRKDDTMLAQICLRIVFNESQNPSLASIFTPPPDTGVIEPDGFYGPTTRKYIARFKQVIVASGLSLHPDEVLDPFRDNNPSSIGLIAGKQYAFGLLLIQARDSDQDRLLGLVEDARTPGLLRNALKQTREQALQYRFG